MVYTVSTSRIDGPFGTARRGHHEVAELLALVRRAQASDARRLEGQQDVEGAARGVAGSSLPRPESRGKPLPSRVVGAGTERVVHGDLIEEAVVPIAQARGQSIPR
jgi:hypothetical protein